MNVISAEAEARSGAWDRIGIGISGLCVLHCLFLPILIVAAPLMPVLTAVHAWVHPIFALLLVPTTFAAGLYGRREHRRNGPLVLLGIGMAVVLAGGVLGHEMPGAALETVLTVAGSGILVAGHWRNWQLARLTHRHVPAMKPAAFGAVVLAVEEPCND